MLAPPKVGVSPSRWAGAFSRVPGGFGGLPHKRPTWPISPAAGTPPAQPIKAAQTASQRGIGGSVTAVTDVTGNRSPIFPVIPVTAVTRITGDMQLPRVPGSAGRDTDAEFIQAGSVLCKFL